MMFSSRTGWHLSFTLLAVTFLLYILLGLWFTERSTVSKRPAHALDDILSPASIDALYNDARLHHAVLDLTETVAKASLSYGEKLESAGLRDLGKGMISRIARVRTQKTAGQRKRQLFGGGEQKDGFGGFVSGLFGGDSNSTGLGDVFQQALSGISDDILSSLATPAYFLGIGIGMGAETGLNFTSPEESEATAAEVAAASGEEATGLNLIAQSLGAGLSGQLAPALGNLGTSDTSIGMAVFALAQGVGQASASGLNLTQRQFSPTNGSDIMDIAKNFGLGVTGPIASNLDLQKLFSQGNGASDFMAQIPQIAAAAGEGLGQGASRGLGLTKRGATGNITKRQTTNETTQMDIPGIVGNLTMGLSQSFLETSDLSALLPGGSGGISFDASSLVLLASGAGKGIGDGIATGLGIMPGNESALAILTNGGGNKTEEVVAEQFTKNLMSSLLQNGGMKAIGDSLMTQAGGLTTNVEITKAAEGAARGLVEGSISALSEAGGFQKVISGDFPKELAMNLPSLPPTQFNDSLSGSVVAFMRGLSGEGVLLVSQMLNKDKNNTNNTPAKRSVDGSGVVSTHALSRRADTVIPAFDEKSLQDIAQTGLETVTCSGFGGLAALALGVTQSPALKNSDMLGLSTVPLDNSTLAALPKGPVTIMNEGNKLTVNLADRAVTINGLDLKPFAIITALHVLFSTLAFFFALPAYLALGAIWRFSEMIGQPIDDAKMKKWRMVVLLGLFTPFAIVGIVLGIAGKGSAAHFQTPHSIFGLVALVLIIPSVTFGIVRLRTTVPIPPPSAFLFKNQIAAMKGPHKIHIISNMLIQQTLGVGMISWVQGFMDLRSISLCVVDAVLTAPVLVGVMNLVLFMQIGSTGLLIARFILERRLAQSGQSGESGGSGETYDDATFFEKMKITKIKRTDTMKTFGFDSVPPPLDRPPLVERKTADLLGKEDSQIGLPMNARKLGEVDPHPGTRVFSTSGDPFADTSEQIVSPRIYNAKLGGFEDDNTPAYPPPVSYTNIPSVSNYTDINTFNNNTYNNNTYKNNTYNNDMYNDNTARTDRASSEVYPQSQYISYATSAIGIDENNLSGTPGPTLKRFESFSRPIKGPRVPKMSTEFERDGDRPFDTGYEDMSGMNPYTFDSGRGR